MLLKAAVKRKMSLINLKNKEHYWCPVTFRSRNKLSIKVAAVQRWKRRACQNNFFRCPNQTIRVEPRLEIARSH